MQQKGKLWVLLGTICHW